MHHPDERAHFYLLSIDYAIDKTFVFSNRPTGILIALPKSLGKPVSGRCFAPSRPVDRCDRKLSARKNALFGD